MRKERDASIPHECRCEVCGATSAEIEREARKGMVPVEDVRLLADTAVDFLYNTKGAGTVATKRLSDEVSILRAKHPNLFTKGFSNEE